jgi:hypothetical protein
LDTSPVDQIRVDVARERRDRWVRAAGLTILAAVTLAGAMGTFGVRTDQVSASGSEGTRLTVTHPTAARPGLAVSLEISISNPAGFTEQIEVSVSTDYLQAHDHNVFHPLPVEATVDDEMTRWTYEPPPGDTLTVWVDHRLEPGVQWSRDGNVRVAIGDEVTDVDFTTRVYP